MIWMNRGAHALWVAQKSDKRDVATLRLETAQRICTAALENGGQEENIRRTIGGAE